MAPPAPSGSSSIERRLLVLAPAGIPPNLIASVILATGAEIATYSDVLQLLNALDQGAAALLITEKAVSIHAAALEAALSKQPPWSDLPVLIIVAKESAPLGAAQASRALGNITLLERPLHAATLVSAINSALRARERQYQMRDRMRSSDSIEQALRDTDHRKDEFLATLGHELRNPLASILTGLELIRLAGLVDPSVQRAMAVIDRQVNYLVRLVNDLLEVSRITRGIIEMRREPLDLAVVLRAAVDASERVIDASQHELQVDIPESPIPIMGDAMRLTQVFANLLNNAAKYTNSGGHLALTARLEGARVVVAVRDDGIGLDPSLLTLVFDLFMQVDRADRRTQGGLGIGLTLVRSLVAMHGGSVEARSGGAGKGSEFVVTLPLMAESRAAIPVKAARRPGFPARRILLVDDNHDAVENLSTLLRALGSEVSVEHNGRDALAHIDAFAPDVVLLDIGMPGLDGYEVARRLRARPRYEHTLLIALTGWGQEEDRRRSRDAGFDHHMVKPPDLDELRDYLDRRRQSDDVEPELRGRRLADRATDGSPTAAPPNQSRSGDEGDGRLPVS